MTCFGTRFPKEADAIVLSGALTRYNHKLAGDLPIQAPADMYVPNALGEGVCSDPAYEGEGAILLEAAIGSWWEGGACADSTASDRYHIDVVKNVATETSTAFDTSVVLMDAAPLFQSLLDDLNADVDVAVIARRFHDAFVDAIVAQAQLVEAVYGIRTVVLSGGVFMNRYLVEHALAALEQAGFTVAINRDLPPNDGCISYGQAVVSQQLM